MKRRINNRYDHKVHSNIFAQNLRVLDRCMNEDLSLDQYRKRNKCMNNLYDPKVPSLTLAQDPKILDGCLNG
jgi:hypothetical protein